MSKKAVSSFFDVQDLLRGRINWFDEQGFGKMRLLPEIDGVSVVFLHHSKGRAFRYDTRRRGWVMDTAMHCEQRDPKTDEEILFVLGHELQGPVARFWGFSNQLTHQLQNCSRKVILRPGMTIEQLVIELQVSSRSIRKKVERRGLDSRLDAELGIRVSESIAREFGFKDIERKE